MIALGGRAAEAASPLPWNKANSGFDEKLTVYFAGLAVEMTQAYMVALGFRRRRPTLPAREKIVPDYFVLRNTQLPVMVVSKAVYGDPGFVVAGIVDNAQTSPAVQQFWTYASRMMERGMPSTVSVEPFVYGMPNWPIVDFKDLGLFSAPVVAVTNTFLEEPLEYGPMGGAVANSEPFVAVLGGRPRPQSQLEPVLATGPHEGRLKSVRTDLLAWFQATYLEIAAMTELAYATVANLGRPNRAPRRSTQQRLLLLHGLAKELQRTLGPEQALAWLRHDGKALLLAKRFDEFERLVNAQISSGHTDPLEPRYRRLGQEPELEIRPRARPIEAELL